MWREGSEEFFIDIGEKLTKKDIRRLHDFHDEVSRQIRIDGAPLTLSIGIGHGKGLDEKGQERLLSDEWFIWLKMMAETKSRCIVLLLTKMKKKVL